MSGYRITLRPDVSNVTVDDEVGARCAGDTEPCVGQRAGTGTTSMLVKPGRIPTASRSPRVTAGQAVSSRGNEERVDPGPGFKERAREVGELVCGAAGVLKALEQPNRFHGEPSGTSSMPGSFCGVLEGGSSLKGCPRQRCWSPTSTRNDTPDVTKGSNGFSQNQILRKDSSLFDMRDHNVHGYTYRQEGQEKIPQEFLNDREAVLYRGRSNLVSRIQYWIWTFFILWNVHVLHAQGKVIFSPVLCLLHVKFLN